MIPRIVGLPEDGIIAVVIHRHLGRVGFPDNDRARRAQPGDSRRILLGHVMLEHLHAPGRAHAFGDYRILDSDWQPFEWANLALAGQTLVGIFSLARRAFFDERDDSIEAVIYRLYPLDKSVDHFDRRHVARPQHRSQPMSRREKKIIRKCHDEVPRLSQEIASRPIYCTRSWSCGRQAAIALNTKVQGLPLPKEA